MQRMMGDMTPELGQVIFMAQVQVDLTSLMVPCLLAWRLLRPVFIGLQGFALLALVNVLVATASKLTYVRV